MVCKLVIAELRRSEMAEKAAELDRVHELLKDGTGRYACQICCMPCVRKPKGCSECTLLWKAVEACFAISRHGNPNTFLRKHQNATGVFPNVCYMRTTVLYCLCNTQPQHKPSSSGTGILHDMQP
jgi:hypothetical protein